MVESSWSSPVTSESSTIGDAEGRWVGPCGVAAAVGGRLRVGVVVGGLGGEVEGPRVGTIVGGVDGEVDGRRVGATVGADVGGLDGKATGLELTSGTTFLPQQWDRTSSVLQLDILSLAAQRGWR